MRDQVLADVARTLSGRDLGHPVRVGIDGVCGVGKSIFAQDLAIHVVSVGRPIILLDSDGFHQARAIRYRQGRDSARGYYEDAYDFDAVRDLVLKPLGPSGSLTYASRVHDLTTDEVILDLATAPNDAIVLFAATFLQRDDLRGHWDEVIFLDADIAIAQSRGICRDLAALGGVEAATRAYDARYMAACGIYLDEQRPKDRASIVIQHDDPFHPRIIRT